MIAKSLIKSCSHLSNLGGKKKENLNEERERPNVDVNNNLLRNNF